MKKGFNHVTFIGMSHIQEQKCTNLNYKLGTSQEL